MVGPSEKLPRHFGPLLESEAVTAPPRWRNVGGWCSSKDIFNS